MVGHQALQAIERFPLGVRLTPVPLATPFATHSSSAKEGGSIGSDCLVLLPVVNETFHRKHIYLINEQLQIMGNAVGVVDEQVAFNRHRDSATTPLSEITIALACQRDEQDAVKMAGSKIAIRKFIREVYNTDESTIMRWTTWDNNTESADIVNRKGYTIVPNAKNAFDIVVSVFCPMGMDGSIEQVYRLLKENGIFMLTGFGEEPDWRDIIQANFDDAKTDFIREYEGCSLVPVDSVEGDDRSKNFWIFQKVRNIATGKRKKRCMENV